MVAKESLFQFTNPTLVGFQIQLNAGFDASHQREVVMPIEISSDISQEEENMAMLKFCCEIGKKDKSTPFWIKAEEQAHFKWDKELDKETVDSLLHQNAPALLLSYLRPIVAQVTAASPYGTYNIPFINLAES